MWFLKDSAILNEKSVLCVLVLVIVPEGKCKKDGKVQLMATEMIEEHTRVM